jgi:hypothetical protein
MNDDIEIEESAPWMVILITLAGGFLRALMLEFKGMWLDETFSVWMASHSIGDMLQWIVKIDQHPPLYYFLLHYWIGLTSNSPYDVRMLSVLFGAATIPVIYLIGKRMAGGVMGMAAAMILAFSPFHIYYAQEARMYTLLTFTAAVALYALVRLLTDPRSAQPIGSQFRQYLRSWRTTGPAAPGSPGDFSYRDLARDQRGWRGWIFRHRFPPIQTIETDLAWVALIIFSAATLLSHNTAVLFILAVNVFVLGLMLFQRMKKSGAQPAFQAPSLPNWAKAQIAILLLWSPWILSLIKQASAVYQRFWIPKPTWEAVLQMLRSFLNASAPLSADLYTAIWLFFGLVLCLGLLHYRRKISQFLFLTVLFAIPLLGELIVSIWRPILWDRTLIWTTIPLFLLLAGGVALLKNRYLIVLALMALCTINLFSVSDYFRFYQKEDWKTAARSVAGFAEKDDLILFNSNFVEIPFDYYFDPYAELYSLQVEERGLPLDLVESGRLEPEMTASDIPALLALLDGHPRVWLVYSHADYTDPAGLIPQTLAARMSLTRENEFYGGVVQLYVSP